MDPTEMDVEVNGMLSTYRLIELREEQEACLMHLGFEIKVGELPAFEVNDLISLMYSLYSVDWRTTQAKVRERTGKQFWVTIEFQHLMRRFHEMSAPAGEEDMLKLICD